MTNSLEWYKNVIATTSTRPCLLMHKSTGCWFFHSFLKPSYLAKIDDQWASFLVRFLRISVSLNTSNKERDKHMYLKRFVSHQVAFFLSLNYLQLTLWNWVHRIDPLWPPKTTFFLCFTHSSLIGHWSCISVLMFKLTVEKYASIEKDWLICIDWQCQPCIPYASLVFLPLKPKIKLEYFHQQYSRYAL